MIEILSEYPRYTRPSRFLLQSRIPSSSSSLTNQGIKEQYNPLLKDIEIEVNAYYNELIPNDSRDWLLSHQIRKRILSKQQVIEEKIVIMQLLFPPKTAKGE